MKIFHHYHHSKHGNIIHSDFWNFELSIWLQAVGLSVVSIFIPVLMLNAGYSLPLVLAYCAMFFLLDTPLNFLANKLIRQIGAKTVIILGTVSMIGYFILFSKLEGGGFVTLALLAALIAIYDSFYWVAYFYIFAESTGKKDEISRNNGIVNGIRSFGGMLGPSVGAAMLVFGSNRALLATGIFFLALSVLPLLFLRHPKNKPDEISMAGFFKEEPEKKNFLFWFLYAIHLAANDVIWPIFIFMTFDTLSSVAIVAIAISISKIILSYMSGAAKAASREKIMAVGACCLIVVWIFRLLYPNPVFYYLSILMVGIIAVLIEVPLDGSVFERAKERRQTLTASTFRNAIIMFPQGVLFAILAVLVGVFKVSFVSAIASLTVLLVINQIFFSHKLSHRPKARK